MVKPVEYSYTLDKKSFETTITIRDEDKKVVFTADGEHDVVVVTRAGWPHRMATSSSPTFTPSGFGSTKTQTQSLSNDETGSHRRTSGRQGRAHHGRTYASIDDILAVSTPGHRRASTDKRSEASEESADEKPEDIGGHPETGSRERRASKDEKTDPRPRNVEDHRGGKLKISNQQDKIGDRPNNCRAKTMSLWSTFLRRFRAFHQSSAMGAVSDNIVNVSTIGYKTAVNFKPW